MDAEEFWAPISQAVATDFADLGLSPPFIDHRADTILVISGSGDGLATVSRHAAERHDDPARMMVEVARALTPRMER